MANTRSNNSVYKNLNQTCLMGASLDTGNMGVSALCVSLLNLINEQNPDSELYLFVPGRKNRIVEVYLKKNRKTVSVVTYRMSPFANPKHQLIFLLMVSMLYRLIPFRSFRAYIRKTNPVIRMLVSSSIIADIFGGDSFSDIYGLARFLKYSIPRLVIATLGEQIIFLPQTYGPFKTGTARSVARILLKRARMIISRDEESIDTVKNLLTYDPGILYCPDVAFSLPKVEPQRKDDSLSDFLNREQNLVGINVSGLLLNGGYNQKNMFNLTVDYEAVIVGTIEHILDNSDDYILLVPHTFAADDSVENDYVAATQLINRMSEVYRKRIRIVLPAYDQSELKWLIGECNFFIGSRMHSCIAALSQGVPTVGFAYSKKFRGVFTSIGCPQMVVDATKHTTESAIEAITENLQKRDCTSLSNSVKAVEEKIQAVFTKIGI